MKQKITATVLSQKEIAPDIFDMWIATKLAEQAVPGQFLCIYPKDRSTLLPRPISICEAAENKESLRIVYRVAGQGTKEFSGYQAGERISLLGTLGNGFPLEAGKGKKVFLMGGGIGVPPILQLAKALGQEPRGCESRKRVVHGQETQEQGTLVQIIVGYRDGHLFLADDLSKYGDLYLATEDGSAGTKGNVMDAVAANGLEADVIFACGPMPMLRAIKQYALEKEIPAYLSLEEHMACGVGACLGCVVKTREIDHHSHVHNARICTDGPVFEAREVDI